MNYVPKRFPSSERAYYPTADAKYGEAIKRGAIGVINFSLPSNKRSTWDASVKRSKSGSFKWVNAQSVAANSYPALKAVASFNNEYVAQLFTGAATGIEKIYELAEEGKS